MHTITPTPLLPDIDRDGAVERMLPALMSEGLSQLEREHMTPYRRAQRIIAALIPSNPHAPYDAALASLNEQRAYVVCPVIIDEQLKTLDRREQRAKGHVIVNALIGAGLLSAADLA